MKRDPSIHIRESHLYEIVNEVMEQVKEKFLGKKDVEPEEFNNTLVYFIVRKAKKYAINNRNILEGNAKLLSKAANITLNSRDKSNLFADTLNSVRRYLQHRGITKIKPGDKEWDMIKVLTESALGFCEDFKLKPRNGFTIYITIGINKMRGYSLNKFKSLHSSICNYQEALLTIQNDPTPGSTQEVYNYYSKKLNELVGLSPNYTKDPESFCYFISAKENSIITGVDFKTYIDAQFEGLSWTGSAPEPQQLVGEKAIARLTKYLNKNGLTAKKPLSKINWAAIKDDNHNNK